MNGVELAYLGMSVLLAVSGAIIVYPAVAGVQLVIYRRAVLALGASILMFVASWLVLFLYALDLVDQTTISLISLGGSTVAGSLHLVAVWWFARDFITFEQSTVDIGVDETETGGFTNERE